MKRSGLLLTIVFLIIVNIIVMAGVAANRRGVPDASLELTERELPMAWVSHADENTGVALKLNWNLLEADWSWFDHDKLAEFGINIEKLTPDDDNYRYRHLPVPGFAVLEHEGESWKTFIGKRLKERKKLEGNVTDKTMTVEVAERRRKQIDNELRLASRLFIIDAGNDPDSLRLKYPDGSRFLILPAEIRLNWNWEPSTNGARKQSYRGSVSRILVDTIHVPSQFHATLEELPEQGRIFPHMSYYNPEEQLGGPRYSVRLNTGSRYEPWIVAIMATQGG